jgi:hypothetical protein
MRITSAPRRSAAGDGMAHLARRAIGEVADGVDGLARRARGDEDAFAGQIASRREQALERLDDGIDLRQPSPPGQPGSQLARVGLQHRHAALPQHPHIGHDGRMLPHAAVHGGGDEDRAAGGEKQRRQKVVCDSVSGLREQIGGGGRHDQGLRPLRELDVLDGIGRLRIEKVGEHRPARERPEGQRAHELFGVRRGHHGHPRAEPRELAQ